MRIIILVLLSFIVLQGCGRKAALFLPPPAGEAQTISNQLEPKQQP